MKSRTIFVFGSNLAGIHGTGSALRAVKNFGAVRGLGVGLSGNSYAIPTKDENLLTLPLKEIKKHVDKFIEFAKSSPNLTFNIVAIGCGLAGYEVSDIVPMFDEVSDNCNLPKEFLDYLSEL